MAQYLVTVKPNNEIKELSCNGGWKKPEKDGNYIFSYCDKEGDDYTVVGFSPIFIPKKFVIGTQKHAKGDWAL